MLTCLLGNYVVHNCNRNFLKLEPFCYVFESVPFAVYTPCFLKNLISCCRRPGKDNPFRCTYVLPDGVNHTKGFVKDPEEAKRYLKLMNGSDSSALGAQNRNKPDDVEMLEDRKKTDPAKNVIVTFHLENGSPFWPCLMGDCPLLQEFDLTNERFIVPEMIFRPADLGLYLTITVSIQF